MNTCRKISITIIIIFALIIIFNIIKNASNRDAELFSNFDSCLSVVNAAQPDPNETAERSTLLETCTNEN